MLGYFQSPSLEPGTLHMHWRGQVALKLLRDECLDAQFRKRQIPLSVMKVYLGRGMFITSDALTHEWHCTAEWKSDHCSEWQTHMLLYTTTVTIVAPILPANYFRRRPRQHGFVTFPMLLTTAALHSPDWFWPKPKVSMTCSQCLTPSLHCSLLVLLLCYSWLCTLSKVQQRE